MDLNYFIQLQMAHGGAPTFWSSSTEWIRFTLPLTPHLSEMGSERLLRHLRQVSELYLHRIMRRAMLVFVPESCPFTLKARAP